MDPLALARTHSVRSVVRHSVTFASADLSSPSTSDSAQDKEPDRASGPIVFQPAENSPRVSKRNSLLSASKRTLSRLKRKKTVPVTITEEITVERILLDDPQQARAPSEAEPAPRDSFTTESADTADTPSSLGARRHAFAKLARAAFAAPGKVVSRTSSERKHRRQPAPAPVPVVPPPAPSVDPPPSAPSAPESIVAPASTPTTPAASSPDPKKPKFRAKLNQLWYTQSASRISLPQPRPPSHSAESLGDSALFPLAPESSRSSRLHRVSSRFSRRSRYTKSRSTVHLERIPETVTTADGQALIVPEFFSDSPVSAHSELYPDSSAPAPSRRQSWWASASQVFNQTRSRLPSTATLPDGLSPEDVHLAQELLRTAGVSRPVSEALFPYDFDFLASPLSPPAPQGKPKLSIVTAGTSKGEPQQKTPRSILKSPSRSFFRRYSSPPPPVPPAAVPQPVDSKATSSFPQGFLLHASRASLNRLAPPPPPPPVTELAPQSTQLFPLSPLTPPPAFDAPDQSTFFHPPPLSHEFFVPSEKPTAGQYAPDLIPITVEDEHGNSVWYIENQPTSTQQDPIPIPIIPASAEQDPYYNMGAKDFADDGINFAEDEEYDERVEWFQNRPPKADPPPPRTASTIYQPLPGVIEQNEHFLTALSNAHIVLYKAYQDFGQMGVFGWTSDFSDLIDALKTLGFEGNMFVSTRQAALEACVRIMRLKIDLKMQIITIYLTNQVSRLRRFLDADKQWDDYPPITFPTDPYAV